MNLRPLNVVAIVFSVFIQFKFISCLVECESKNIRGDTIKFRHQDVFRRYTDPQGKCSQWCQCKNTKRVCGEGGELPCLQGKRCVTKVDNKHVDLEFGGTLFMKNRDSCTCHDERFICTKPEPRSDLDLAKLEPGLYVFVGFSDAETRHIRKHLPQFLHDPAGFTRDHTSVWHDIRAQLQKFMTRLPDYRSECEILHFRSIGDNIIYRVGYRNESGGYLFGSEVKTNCLRTTIALRQEWFDGGPAAYQLLLSTIKEMKLQDLLPERENGIPLSMNQFGHVQFCVTILLALATYILNDCCLRRTLPLATAIPAIT